jgi:hypothetical protein
MASAACEAHDVVRDEASSSSVTALRSRLTEPMPGVSMRVIHRSASLARNASSDAISPTGVSSSSGSIPPGSSWLSWLVPSLRWTTRRSGCP